MNDFDRKTIRLGISTCPNDTFTFHALINRLVDWRGLELYDYPQIITKMMDLGTIKRKLERGHYATAHQVAEDVRLVWTNCMTYNADGSDFYKLADSLQKKWDDKYTKVLQDCASANAAEAASTETVTMTDRRNFAKALRSAVEATSFTDGRFLLEISTMISHMSRPCLRLELLQYVLGLDNRFSIAHVSRSVELAATCC